MVNAKLNGMVYAIIYDQRFIAKYNEYALCILWGTDKIGTYTLLLNVSSTSIIKGWGNLLQYSYAVTQTQNIRERPYYIVLCII